MAEWKELIHDESARRDYLDSDESSSSSSMDSDGADDSDESDPEEEEDEGDEEMQCWMIHVVSARTYNAFWSSINYELGRKKRKVKGVNRVRPSQVDDSVRRGREQ